MTSNPTPYALAWSDTIKAGRKRKEYSRADLASKLEVTYQAVQNWETCQAQPSPRHQALMIGLLGITDRELSAIALKAAYDPKAGDAA